MKQFQRGLYEVIVGIVGGIVISALLQSFKENNVIPSNYVYLFTAIGFVGSLATLFSFWKTGIVFTLGWIVGAWLLKDVLSTGDFIIYFVAPIATLVIRGIAFFKKQSRLR